jgi:hypothetical protein
MRREWPLGSETFFACQCLSAMLQRFGANRAVRSVKIVTLRFIDREGKTLEKGTNEGT